MLTKIPLITPSQCDSIIQIIDTQEWIDGETGSDQYKEIKQNLELPIGINKAVDDHIDWILQMLTGSSEFTNKTLPCNLTRPRFNKYLNGGQYKLHSDSAFMGSSPEIRTDISMTLFMSDPGSYQGGELVLCYTSGARIELKEPQGTLVVYPSGVLHGVNPVTSGVRIAFVAWLESHIQDPQKREILVEITELCEQMKYLDAYSDAHTRALNIKHNLFRQWLKKA